MRRPLGAFLNSNKHQHSGTKQGKFAGSCPVGSKKLKRNYYECILMKALDLKGNRFNISLSSGIGKLVNLIIFKDSISLSGFILDFLTEIFDGI
jgi:hypothetical protein